MILVSDNLQITHGAVDRAVREMDPAPIQDLVGRCVAAGAEAVDINSGPLARDPERKMAFLVEAVQSVTDLPVLLDTTNPKALEAGLQVSKSKTVINGFSLEPVKLERILPLARKYDVDIISTPTATSPAMNRSASTSRWNCSGSFKRRGWTGSA
jgi:5-methyltetrahydrofolate corrinoid/iron sulfur protein methyltransferase